jgi:hypothetical protein
LKKENVIFIDIDGPLLPARQWYSKENSRIFREIGGNFDLIRSDFNLKKRIQFDPIAVQFFNAWAKLSGAKFVLATNWTLHTTIVELLELFLINGLEIKFHDDPITPKKYSSNRLQEIHFWLDNNLDCINNFIVVDDDYSLDPNHLKDIGGYFAEFSNHVIFVNYSNGLSINDFKVGAKILGIKDRKAKDYFFELPE